MERRPGCTSHLHRPRGLHVFHMGLDWPVQGTDRTDTEREITNDTDLISWGWGFFFSAGGIQERVRLWNLCVGQRERPAGDKWSHTGRVQVWYLCHVWTNTTCVWMHASFIWTYMRTLWLQISVDKDEIPLLSGQYLLGYFSTNMQSILGLSANFQVSVPLLHLQSHFIMHVNLIILSLPMKILCNLCSKTHHLVLNYPYLFWSCRYWSQSALSWRASFLRTSTESTNKKKFTSVPHRVPGNVLRIDSDFQMPPRSAPSSTGRAGTVIK